ncbi:MAG: MBL fold metallo-hydrolase, partial [Shewanella sp.]
MLTITAINAFNDNYIWVLQQGSSENVYVVDPGDANEVIRYLTSNALTLAGVLVTHHHRDHTGGIAELIAYAQHTTTAPLQVYGPDNDSILGVNCPIDPNISPELSLPFINSKIQVLSIPGHTIDHIAYFIEDALFCGDTLFSAGCGRLFEGTAAQMFDSLA